MFKDGKRSAEQNCAIWNSRFAGKEALASLDANGYKTGNLFYRRTKAHRAIWAMAYGKWPDGEIDHINGHKSDNRLDNLRVVTHLANGRNLKLKKNNQSGYCGVWQRPSGRWAALISLNGKTKTLGTFDTIEEAIAARQKANAEHGFHANHGVSAS